MGDLWGWPSLLFSAFGFFLLAFSSPVAGTSRAAGTKRLQQPGASWAELALPSASRISPSTGPFRSMEGGLRWCGPGAPRPQVQVGSGAL